MNTHFPEFSREIIEINGNCLSRASVSGHKVILAARSDYFRTLLYGGFSEANKKEVKLDVSISLKISD